MQGKRNKKIRMNMKQKSQNPRNKLLFSTLAMSINSLHTLRYFTWLQMETSPNIDNIDTY